MIKSRLLGAHQAILSATAVNAALFRIEDRIGTVEAGKDADLILVSGEPLDRVELLADPLCLPIVLKGGRIVKDAEGRVAAASQGDANDDGTRWGAIEVRGARENNLGTSASTSRNGA